MTGPGRQLFRRIAGTVAAALVVSLIPVPATSAAPTPFTDIHSVGPLSDIYIGNDLGCQVRNGGFSTTEYFPNVSGPGDCGTFLSFNSDTIPSVLSGLDFANHSGGANSTGHFSFTEVPYTPVSQTLTGSGTAATPYRVTTTVTATTPNQEWRCGLPPDH